MWYIVWALFSLVCVYQGLDVYQTYLLLQLGCQEVNPIVRLSIAWFGVVPGMIMTKLLFVIILGIPLYIYQKIDRRTA